MVANRIISGISALILANRHNNPGRSSLLINPELTHDKNYNIDGLRINLIKNF